jgi:hypothetical protein
VVYSHKNKAGCPALTRHPAHNSATYYISNKPYGGGTSVVTVVVVVTVFVLVDVIVVTTGDRYISVEV